VGIQRIYELGGGALSPRNGHSVMKTHGWTYVLRVKTMSIVLSAGLA